MSDTKTVEQTERTSDTCRWRPTRAGLINVWRYWDETFHFHDGRLLLRGPNGSGKSLALELLLPFLLDANAQPHRLTSAARSRGGLYDRMMAGVTTTSRAGFVWIEFQRSTSGPTRENGSTESHVETFTIGARLRASQTTRRAETSFFTTSLVVGDTLRLLDEVRAPLERKALIDAIGTTGRVSDRGHEHRAAVRQTLYPGFSEDRYDALISALLALRKEKLSQGLDLDKMSEILSHALPPIEEHDLAAVAEGFERLDRRRDELVALEAELAVVGRLATARRHYARVIVAGVAADVRRAESQRDAVTRRQRQAEVDLDTITEQLAADELALRAGETRAVEVDAEIAAIQGSEAYRDGAALSDLMTEVDRLDRAVATEADRRDRAAAIAERKVAERTAAETAAEQARDAEARTRSDVRDAAVRAGAAGVVADAQAPSEVEAWASARRTSIDQVREAIRNHDAVVADRDRAIVRLTEAEQDLETRRREVDATVDALDQAEADYRQAVVAWAGSAAAIGQERASEAVRSTAFETFATPHQLLDAVTGELRELAALISAEHAVARRDIEAEIDELRERAQELEAERRELEQATVVAPAAPAWRSDRSGRPGAPLWSLVEVRAGIDAAVVDGVEAAMRASGLVDAWVRPDGTVKLPSGIADLALGSSGAPSGPESDRNPGRSLAEILEPSEAVDFKPVVAGLLALLPIADDVNEADLRDGGDRPDLIIGLDGSFRLGPGLGRGQLRPAELLGSVARERRRRERVAELREELADVERASADCARRLDRVDGEQAAVDADFAAAPSGADVVRHANSVELARVREDDAQQHQHRARAALDRAEQEVRTALRSLSVLAAQNDLPTTEEQLAEVERRLDGLRAATMGWREGVASRDRADEWQSRMSTEAAEATALAEEAESHHRQSVDVASVARARVKALTESVGVEYAELVERLQSLDQERAELRRTLGDLRTSQLGLSEDSGRLRSLLEQAMTDREQAESHRIATHSRFGDLGSDGLIAETGLELESDLDSGGAEDPDRAPVDERAGADRDHSVTAVLTAAREVAAALDDIEHGSDHVERATARLQESLHSARSSLGGRVDLDDRLTEHGWWMLMASTDGVLRTTSELQVHLRGQLETGRNELAEDEEALFERTLAGSIRQALALRIRQANSLVDAINSELSGVRTAAGAVGVKLRWVVDDQQPPAVKAARNQLLRDPATLTDAERSNLHDFVRARVEQARADLGENAPWQERLRETLDYRRWHRFGLQVAHRDWNGLRPATDRLLAALSTGERSIALHLPMLASIVAHYSGEAEGGSERGRAGSACPRLILLDELFAGVDQANRAQLFGTFTSWDLDAILTSDHEWCAYPALSGIAIHFLHPAGDDEPVTSTRFVWDGHARTEASVEPAP